MPVLKKMQAFLDENKIKYQVTTHSLAFTAQEIAAAEHIPGDQIAKVVMIKQNGVPIMAVLPGPYKIDFEVLREVLGKTAVRLESEEEFTGLFPGCETGAEPPFGNLFKLEVLVDTALTKNDEIVFNAGSHRQSIRMRYEDYARLVQPRVATFARHL